MKLNRYTALLFCVLLCLSACKESPKKMDFSALDIQGHRGCRGLLPENTIPGFLKALELGVTTLEMDVCISKDSQVVVSHEPWLSAEICSLDSVELSDENQTEYNIYQLTYAEIAEADCGSKPHPRFPEQKQLSASKPRLVDVIHSVKAHCKMHHIPVPKFNIETKMRPEGDGVYHPKPTIFCDLVMKVVQDEQIDSLVTLQSFDFRALEYMHERYPNIILAALVENVMGAEANLTKLSFKPKIYSPYFKLINASDVADLQAQGIAVKPWTVNDKADIETVLSYGVDGIITDYPNRVFEVIEKAKSLN